MWLPVSAPSTGREGAVVVKEVAAGERSTHERAALARVAGLDHPNLLPVLALWDHDAADHGIGLSVVMPYVAGGTLRDLLESRGALTAGGVVAVVASLAGAIQALHGVGLVHGDVKPENILFDLDGTPLLADPATLSGGHLLRSSIAYAAPEVHAGRVGLAADIYSLAVVAYESLTARRPHGGSRAQIQVASSRGLHRSLTSWPSVPTATAEVVERALDPNPAQRPATVESFAQLLAATVTADQIVLPIPEPGACPSLWVDQETTTIDLGLRSRPGLDPDPRPARLRAWPTRRRSQSRRCP